LLPKKETKSTHCIESENSEGCASGQFFRFEKKQEIV
jgi:hypothetical protein